MIAKIKSLRHKGFTIGEIMIKTGLPKTTVHEYIKDMPKPQRVLDRKRVHILKLQKLQANKRRGKSIKPYKIRIPKSWDKNVVLLISHLIFDGEITKSSCIYNNRSKALINRVVDLMYKVFGTDDYKLLKKPDGVMRVSFHHVELANMAKDKARELIKYINFAPSDHKRQFLTAFFDDEGNIYIRNRTRKVRGYQHNYEILNLVQDLLLHFGISSKLENKDREIAITRKDNLIKFRDEINFSSGVRINGKRSNSIWKRSLEKRVLLDMAIKSYIN